MEKRVIQIAVPTTGDEEWQALREPLNSGWITQGPKVTAFENRFAEIHGASHALAVTSCTTGLHLILAGLGIGPGDEVIVPAFTWVSTANVILYCGATPVFVDVEADTHNISVSEVAKAVTSKTKAVMAVHLFGLCADIDGLRSVLPDHVKIIEDAACAAGASYKGQMAGTLGDAAAFSFHPRKSITTGEGGMVTTNDAALGEVMNKLRNHGAEISEEQRHHGPRPYILPEFNFLGYNYRMTDLQGAVGVVQIEKLQTLIAERQKWARYYVQALEEIDWLSMPVGAGEMHHALQAFVTRIHPDKAPMSRNDIMDKLMSLGIATRPGTHAVHMLGYYQQSFGFHEDDFPNAKLSDTQSMAIPLHNKMNQEDFDHVIAAIRSI